MLPPLPSEVLAARAPDSCVPCILAVEIGLDHELSADRTALRSMRPLDAHDADHGYYDLSAVTTATNVPAALERALGVRATTLTFAYAALNSPTSAASGSAPAIQRNQSSVVCSWHSVVDSVSVISATTNRAPGFITRCISCTTRGLSGQRLRMPLA